MRIDRQEILELIIGILLGLGIGLYALNASGALIETLNF